MWRIRTHRYSWYEVKFVPRFRFQDTMQLHEWCCLGEFRNISEAWEIFLRSAVWFLDERSQESVFVRLSANSSRSDLSIYNERSSTSLEGLATVKTSIGLTRTRRPSVFRQTGRLAKKRLKFMKMFRSCKHMSTSIDSYGFLQKSIFFLLPFFLPRNSPFLISF